MKKTTDFVVTSKTADFVAALGGVELLPYQKQILDIITSDRPLHIVLGGRHCGMATVRRVAAEIKCKATSKPK